MTTEPEAPLAQWSYGHTNTHGHQIFDPDKTHYLKPGKEDKEKEEKDEKGQKTAIGKTPSPFGEEPFFGGKKQLSAAKQKLDQKAALRNVIADDKVAGMSSRVGPLDAGEGDVLTGRSLGWSRRDVLTGRCGKCGLGRCF